MYLGSILYLQISVHKAPVWPYASELLFQATISTVAELVLACLA